MNEAFRAFPQEFLELTRYWAEARCQLLVSPLRGDQNRASDQTTLAHMTERLAEIAEEVDEEDAERIVAEVEDRYRKIVGDEAWHVLKEGTPDEQQALADEWNKRASVQENSPVADAPVPGVTIHHVTDGAVTKGWMHTHGMDTFGLPELEIRHVPSYFVDAAARILREACRYLQKPDVVVKVGEAMATSPQTTFRFVRATPLAGNEDHYHVERWQLVEMASECGNCGQPPDSLHHAAAALYACFSPEELPSDSARFRGQSFWERCEGWARNAVDSLNSELTEFQSEGSKDNGD